MTSRPYPAALLALLAALVFAASASSAPPELGKPAARKAAVAKMNSYLAAHPWAKSGKVGRCDRKAARRVVCAVTVVGSNRSCRVRAVVKRPSGKVRARLGRLACSTQIGSSGRFVRFAAHLGQPQRHLDDPFAVTYPFAASADSAEASAVQEQGDVALEPTALPSGVLAFYNDGILECALNVGGVVVGDECQVAYEKLGQHRVTSIYTSGSESAVATELQDIQPLATSVELAVEYQEFPESELYGEFWWQIGSLVIDASTSPGANGEVQLCLPGGGGGCLAVPWAADAPTEIPILGVQCGAAGERNDEPLCEVRIENAWYPLDFPEAGIAITASRLGGNGYLGSESSLLAQFTPQLHFPACEPEQTAPWC